MKSRSVICVFAGAICIAGIYGCGEKAAEAPAAAPPPKSSNVEVHPNFDDARAPTMIVNVPDGETPTTTQSVPARK